MNYSFIVANLLYKIDINDYFGFALNYAINKYVNHKIIKEVNDKKITKEQFRQVLMPKNDKENKAVEAKMELFPVNKGKINGNIYNIEVKEYEDEVILTKIEK